MKYSKKQFELDGEQVWAVTTGKKYFPETVTTDEDTVTLKAVVMSAQWHREQIDKLDEVYEATTGESLYEHHFA